MSKLNNSFDHFPRCHSCNELLNMIYFYVYQHTYKESCGFGFSRSFPNTKCGIDLPNKCSGCYKKYDAHSGHIFGDHKTAACEDCMIRFNEWRKKSAPAEVRCPKCEIFFEPNYTSRNEPYCVMEHKHYDYDFKIGVKYRFGDGVYRYAGNSCWTWMREA